ncbi:MAG: S9 family peptidase, partial [Sphingomonadales bacterium]|nr:S9 family peptidase [Sphingomonadales bacterium]
MLHRGEALSGAKLVYETTPKQMGVFAGTYTRPEGNSTFLISLPSFFENEVIHVDKAGTATQLPLPLGIDFKGIIKGDVVIGLRKDWVVNDITYPKGALVSMPLDEALQDGAFKTIRTVFQPNASTVLDSSASLHMGKSSIFLPVMNNVIGKVLKAEFDGVKWTSYTLDFPNDGTLSVISVDDETDDALINYDSFLTPDSLYAMNGGEAKVIKSLPARFDASNLESEQRWATSKDGTKIPYFIISPKGMKMDGNTPTLQYGYGGFEISLKPGYASVFGQGWLKQGGAYVIANIRGGGEFGPAWHQAALLQNRQRAYDDFIAVSEALIDTGVTSPRRLGIMGGSNGGLLMGAMFTQRPDLYEAVICAVPLLDMIRYNKLLAGASWMGEYGNPDIAEQREYILEYSPYQNVRTNTSYPE